MDIAFEQIGLQKALARAGSQGACVHPEWLALRARMLASHEAWRALDKERAEAATTARGSFDKIAARLVCVFQMDSGGVNPIDSANRNPGGDNLTAAAGTSRTGVRG